MCSFVRPLFVRVRLFIRALLCVRLRVSLLVSVCLRLFIVLLFGFVFGLCVCCLFVCLFVSCWLTFLSLSLSLLPRALNMLLFVPLFAWLS